MACTSSRGIMEELQILGFQAEMLKGDLRVIEEAVGEAVGAGGSGEGD